MGPLAQWGVANPINKFVDSSSSWFDTLSGLISFSSIEYSLSYVIIFFSTLDLSPESKLGGPGLGSKLSEGLLNKKDIILSETYTGPFPKVGLLLNIRNVTDSRLRLFDLVSVVILDLVPGSEEDL